MKNNIPTVCVIAKKLSSSNPVCFGPPSVLINAFVRASCLVRARKCESAKPKTWNWSRDSFHREFFTLIGPAQKGARFSTFFSLVARRQLRLSLSSLSLVRAQSHFAQKRKTIFSVCCCRSWSEHAPLCNLQGTRSRTSPPETRTRPDSPSE